MYSIKGMVLGGKSINITITWLLILRTHSVVWQRQRSIRRQLLTAGAQTLELLTLGEPGKTPQKGWHLSRGWRMTGVEGHVCKTGREL